MSETPSISETPGPEATPDQDALVRSLLGLLRPDDIAMPDEVIRRLDAVLAQERLTSARASLASEAGATSIADPTDPAAPGSGHDWVAPVTVLPVRRGPSMRAFKILGGVAAAGVLGLVGVAALSNGLGGGGSSSTSAGSSSSAPAPAMAADGSGTLMRSSGATYSAATLPQQVGALVTASRDVKAESAQTTGGALGASGSATPQPSPLGRVALSAATLPDCMLQLTGRTDVSAVVVDHGTFAGKDADIVVVPTQDDPSTLDVWVIAPGCTATSAELFLFQRIPAP